MLDQVEREHNVRANPATEGSLTEALKARESSIPSPLGVGAFDEQTGPRQMKSMALVLDDSILEPATQDTVGIINPRVEVGNSVHEEPTINMTQETIVNPVIEISYTEWESANELMNVSPNTKNTRESVTEVANANP